jgi:hypothetical protein
MTTRTKGVTVGPAAVIVAASSRLPGTRGRRRKRKQGKFGRKVAAASHAAGKVRGALRQLERATMMIGAVMAGLELLRDVRLEGSNRTAPDERTSQASSRSRSDRGKASRTSSKLGKRPAPTSPTRATKKTGGPKKKPRGTATATRRTRSRAAAKKAARARATDRAQARSRASTKRTRRYRQSRSASTRSRA